MHPLSFSPTRRRTSSGADWIPSRGTGSDPRRDERPRIAHDRSRYPDRERDRPLARIVSSLRLPKRVPCLYFANTARLVLCHDTIRHEQDGSSQVQVSRARYFSTSTRPRGSSPSPFIHPVACRRPQKSAFPDDHLLLLLSLSLSRARARARSILQYAFAVMSGTGALLLAYLRMYVAFQPPSLFLLCPLFFLSLCPTCRNRGADSSRVTAAYVLQVRELKERRS